MTLSPASGAPRRSVPSVQYIHCPLTRAGYTLAPEYSHLVLLFSGNAGLREASGKVMAAIEAPRLIWQRQGDEVEFLVESGARGAIVSIAELALMRALPTTPLGDQIRRTLGQHLSLLLDEPGHLNALIDGLARERSTRGPGSEVAAEHFLGLLVIQLWRLARTDLIAHGRSPQGLAERFVQLASLHSREHWRVEDYARTLKVSRDRLGTAVRRATGLAPQAYLHRALIREACELLANTGIPLAQVSFRLGFGDPGYFSRFFTRETGLSPGRYRRNAGTRRTSSEQSYAAWP